MRSPKTSALRLIVDRKPVNWLPNVNTRNTKRTAELETVRNRTQRWRIENTLSD
jgi:hypothetical protein